MAIVKKKNIPVYDEKNCLFSKTKIIPGPFESQANDNDKDWSLCVSHLLL